MITNYHIFSKSISLNEVDQNYVNMYHLDKIIQQLKQKKPIRKKLSEYSDNPSLLSSDITNYTKYLASDISSIHDGVSYDSYSYTLKFYIKTKAYNKLVEILYGKGFQNPTSDKTLIQSTGGNYKPKEAGLIFRELWSDIDEYCNNAVEFLEQGEISDAVKNIQEFVKDTIIDFAIVVILAIITDSTFGLGTAAVASIEGVALTSRITKYGRYLKYSEDVISKLIKIIPKWWARNKELIAFGSKLQGGYYLVTGLIPSLYSSVVEILKEDSSSLSQSDLSSLTIMTKGSMSKDRQINVIKSALESHSGFNSRSLAVYTPFIPNMPGWNSWYQKQENKIEADKIAYIFSYWISYYCWEFQLFLSEMLFLMKIQDKIKQDDLWKGLGEISKKEVTTPFKEKELLKMAEPKVPPAVSTNVEK